jgi:hypothetical protein
MRNIIKQILKEEFDNTYKKKLSILSDKLLNQIKSNIQLGNKYHISYDYIKDVYGLSDEMTEYVYDNIINNIKNIFITWLKEKISNLKSVEILDRIVFIDDYHNKLIFYYKNSDDNNVYVNHEKLWIYLQNYFNLTYVEIQKELFKILKTNFNIPNLKYKNIHTVVNNPFLNSDL